jgi:hypothetical protein
MSFLVEQRDHMVDLLMRKRNMHRNYAAVFGSNEGDMVLRHIMSEGFITKSTYVAGDPNQTMLNEGSRRLALSILRMARTNHKEVIRMVEQQLQEQGIQL